MVVAVHDLGRAATKSANNSPVPSSPGRSTKCLGANYDALAEGIILTFHLRASAYFDGFPVYRDCPDKIAVRGFQLRLM